MGAFGSNTLLGGSDKGVGVSDIRAAETRAGRAQERSASSTASIKGRRLSPNTEAGYDNLTIRDGDGTTLMEERSGECLPGKIWSKTNVVHLHFDTNGWGTRTGWNATWAASTPTGDHFLKTSFI